MASAGVKAPLFSIRFLESWPWKIDFMAWEFIEAPLFISIVHKSWLYTIFFMASDGLKAH